MQGVGTASQQATQVIQGAVLLTRQTMDGILLFVSQVFAGNWAAAWDTIRATVETVWSGIQNTVRGAVNVMIGFVNTLIRAFVTGVNGIIDGLNTLDVTVPDWVPLLGGKHFGVSLSRVSAPQIPLLASGGVHPSADPCHDGASTRAQGPTPRSRRPSRPSARRWLLPTATWWMRCSPRRSRSSTPSGKNGGGVVLSDAVIGRAVRRYNSRQAVITGGARLLIRSYSTRYTIGRPAHAGAGRGGGTELLRPGRQRLRPHRGRGHATALWVREKVATCTALGYALLDREDYAYLEGLMAGKAEFDLRVCGQ